MNNELYLNPNYTFDNFVVGNCNKKAYLYSAAIATTLEGVSSPLILFGSVAVGKTHLLHAIANYVLKKNPDKNVTYATGETFVNDVKETLEQSMNDKNAYLYFDKKYKNADVLLVDRVEDILHDSVVKPIFLEVLRVLFDKKAKVLITTEEQPKNIIFNRKWHIYLKQGEVVEIQRPDFNMRHAILEKNIEKNGLQKYNIPSEAISYIAQNVKENVRLLEGVLNKVIAMYHLNKVDKIDLAFVKKCLQDMDL